MGSAPFLRTAASLAPHGGASSSPPRRPLVSQHRLFYVCVAFCVARCLRPTQRPAAPDPQGVSSYLGYLWLSPSLATVE